MADDSRSNPEGIELVFGLVGPTGVDLDRVTDALRIQLNAVSYDVQVVQLSELISPYLGEKSLSSTGVYFRIKTLMDQGTRLRESTSQPDIVARLGIAQIRTIREKLSGSGQTPAPRTAYIVRSFKRADEVSLFREIYGNAFTLISVYSPRDERREHLARRIGASAKPDGATEEALAVELIDRDYAEEGAKFGQRVGRAFPLADFFVTLGSRSLLDGQLRRLVRLIFGDPYISPTRDEQSMFFARAAAVRSLDLSRQVGAAIVTIDGEVISTGCNEVPKFPGGLYWGEDVRTDRDFERGYDSNASIKSEIVEEVFRKLRGANVLSQEALAKSDRELANSSIFDEGNAFLKSSRLLDVIEFGRSVHAEMAAITQAARLGLPLQDARLFCTTFPCHLCARHIVSSGISEVVFIEPYEKSRTAELYGDSIRVESHEPSSSKVNFRAFVGVAPRRYINLFELIGERKGTDGKVLDAEQIATRPRVSRVALEYISLEDWAISGTAKAPSSGPGDPNE